MTKTNKPSHQSLKRFLSAAVAVAMLGSMQLSAFTDQFVLTVPKAAPEMESDTVIKIFHTNDVHSRYDAAIADDGTLESFGYARLKTLVQKNSSPDENVLLVDAGDVFHGQPFATLTEGSSIAKLLRATGYDAMVPGNHDFNYGSARTTQLAALADVNLLGSNVKKSHDTTPVGYKDYVIYEYGDVKVGMFGLSTPETAYKTNPKNVTTLRFNDPVKTAEATVDTLRNDEKVDVVVCLAHLGNDVASEGNRSTDVAEAVDGIDLIIDGHSHSTPDTYETIGKTAMNSAGNYLEYVGMDTITVDADKNISIKTDSFKASDFKATDLAPNAGVQATIEKIKKEQEPILNKIVSSTPAALDGERQNVRTSETALARLITSAMLKETGADIALTNGGGIRASIDQGPISVADVQTVLPFGNYITTVKVTGKQLKDAIENGLPGTDPASPNGLEVIGKKAQLAGVSVTYDPTKPAGSRIVSITKDNAPIDDNATYLVATNDFMQSGGDDYKALKQPIENEFSALDEALIRYLEEIGTTGIKQIIDEPDRVQVAK